MAQAAFKHSAPVDIRRQTGRVDAGTNSRHRQRECGQHQAAAEAGILERRMVSTIEAVLETSILDLCSIRRRLRAADGEQVEGIVDSDTRRTHTETI